jgi:hypothetical protein
MIDCRLELLCLPLLHSRLNGKMSLETLKHSLYAIALALQYLTYETEEQWRTEGGLGGSNPPEIPKLSQIPRSVENKSVTT